MRPGFFFVIGMTLLLTGSLPAAESKGDLNGDTGAASLHFSTRLGSEFAWDLRWTGTEWVLTFEDDAIVVDDSSPDDRDLMDDYVQLPTMRLSKIQDEGGYLTATLTPSETLEIESFPGMANVLRAAMGLGNTLVIGTTQVSYSRPQDDLDIIFASRDYGVVIPMLAANDAAKFPLDISFTGDAIGGVNLYDLILSKAGCVRGTISGQISSIPEPGTLAVLGLGAALALRLGSRTIRRGSTEARR